MKAFQHFTSSSDEVGAFDSDNAPELIAAAEETGWRHVLSQEYIHKSKAVAERSIRTVLQGTRVALAQAGLNHSYWPHAARHWCLSQNVCEPPSGSRTPWNLRFDEEFKGQFLPFGCRIDYWIGPRQKPKKDLKFDPTSNPGIFVGYVIHPGFLWRGDYLVAGPACHARGVHHGTLSTIRFLQLGRKLLITGSCSTRCGNLLRRSWMKWDISTHQSPLNGPRGARIGSFQR